MIRSREGGADLRDGPLGSTQTHPALQARVSARIQRATLSALMTVVVALVDRRLRKAFDRSRPV